VATLTTATTNFAQTVTALVRKQIDENLRNRAVYLMAGAPVLGKIIPGTNLIRHIAYSDLSVTTNNGVVAAGTPPWTTEAVTPTPEALAIYYEEYGASQAVRIVEISDIALEESPHELMAVAAERVGVNAALTIDLWCAGVLHAGAAAGRVLFSGAATSRATLVATDVLAALDVRKAATILKAANVPPFADGMYRAFIHPHISHDLQAQTSAGGWLDVARYASPESILMGEIGRFAGVRFVETNVGTLVEADGGAGNVDAYSTYVCGPESFAFGDLQSIRAYMVPPGGDHGDIAAQRADVAWKAMFGAKLLTNTGSGLRYVRIESASSVGANA
jgi:N4-gp56 family major capsid protein